MKTKLAILLVVLLVNCFAYNNIEAAVRHADRNNKKVYKEDLNPHHYLLPNRHHLKVVLNKIFSKHDVLKNSKTFREAGFQTLFFRKQTNNLRIASHPLAPGYLFKLYLEDERELSFHEEQVGLIRRAFIASEIRKVIQKHNLVHITVADKWLYQLPQFQKVKTKKTYILVVKDMQLVKRSKSAKMWSKKATQAQLRELYHILSAGYASLSIVRNIPYTKSKKFACIDTEYSKQQYVLESVKRHFSRKNKKKWDRVCNGR